MGVWLEGNGNSLWLDVSGGGGGGVERTRRGGWAMDIRARMKWCLALCGGSVAVVG